jgi:pentatricopeptide repeat protein
MGSIRKLHAHLIVSDLQQYQSHLSKILVSYVSPQNLPDAHALFNQIQAPTIFLWNAMIRGLCKSETPQEAVVFYDRMRSKGLKEDNMTFPFVLKACSVIRSIRDGKRIHASILKLGYLLDVFISNGLVHLYVACGDLGDARLMFSEMPVRDVISWNTIISGYSQLGDMREVLKLFGMMREAGIIGDEVTMVKVLSACSQLSAWRLGESVVSHIEKNCIKIDLYLGNTLIDYYGRCRLVESAEIIFNCMNERNIITLNAMLTTYVNGGDLASARNMFDEMPQRDLISWTSMISGYTQAKCFSDALYLFRKMLKAKVKPDEIVLASVVSACANLGCLQLCRWAHNYVRNNNIRADIHVGNALIDMYMKCGSISEALQVFKRMKEKDTISWNIVILGLANNEFVQDALEMFSIMLKQEIKPNDTTFLGILTACAHGGLVDIGLSYFKRMKAHNIEPQMKHYGCMVHLLGRAGQLDTAYDFIMKMPLRPDQIIWRMLLGACQMHGNVALAETVKKNLK